MDSLSLKGALVFGVLALSVLLLTISESVAVGIPSTTARAATTGKPIKWNNHRQQQEEQLTEKRNGRYHPLLLLGIRGGSSARDSTGRSGRRRRFFGNRKQHSDAGLLSLEGQGDVDSSLVPSSASSSGEDVVMEVAAVTGSATMVASIFNMVNNVAGAGILALSAGQAAGSGWVPAIAICTALGILSALSFVLIGEACELTQEADFKGLWGRTLGKSSTYVVDSMIATLCVAVCIIYSGILGDVFTPLLEQSGWVPPQYNHRTLNIAIITTALLLPMSLIRDLSALAFTSILGFVAIAYTVFFIVYRALDGSYRPGVGRFVTDGVLKLLPSFHKESIWNMDFTSLVLASNLGLAYVAHYNGPNFYRQLKDTNAKRFSRMVSISFSCLIVIYIITMAAGYSTFGDVCQGNLLLNYHPDDTLALLGRLATGFSILFGFPLVATGARESLIGVAASFGKSGLGESWTSHFTLVSTLLFVVTAISCTVKDVSLVVGLTGASMGSFIVYICPPLIYSRAIALAYGEESDRYKNARRLRNMLVTFGVFVGAMGVFMTIQEGLAS